MVKETKFNYGNLRTNSRRTNKMSREGKENAKRHTANNVFAKAGLDNETSAMFKYQQRFGLDVQFSALVHNFNSIFSIGHLYRAGSSMNATTSPMRSPSAAIQNQPKL
jgi:hypothetical protein